MRAFASTAVSRGRGGSHPTPETPYCSGWHIEAAVVRDDEWKAAPLAATSRHTLMTDLRTEPETTKAHCNRCQGDTKHDVLRKESTSWDEEIDEYTSIYGSDHYEILRCRGCESITLQNGIT